MRTIGRQSGFTLVEIAIVLVIIGLLLGGILKGQEMITQARIKNVVNDFNGVTAAYFSYQDRYRSIPGDDPAAQTRWGTAYGASNGTGNSVLGTSGAGYNGTPMTAASVPNASATAVTDAQENTNVWHHLRIAGFIGGPNQGAGSTNQPTNVVGGMVGLQHGGLGLNGLIVCSANVPDKIAAAVDTQLDDQRSASGTLRALAQTAGTTNPATGTTPAANYIEDGTLQYLICRSV